MSEEAMKVWRDACGASQHVWQCKGPAAADQAAAAVIAAAMAADKARIVELEGAMRKIASCETRYPGDVVSIARATLKPEDTSHAE